MNLSLTVFELNSMKYNDVTKFIEVKENLNNIIQRIIKFKLFSLTFLIFFKVLKKETINEYSIEKLVLSSKLHYELHECFVLFQI